MTKTEQALESCNKILEGIEFKNLSISSILALSLRVARLLNDEESILWLQYENGGYPTTPDGHIVHSAWEIAYSHGRGSYNDKQTKIIFTDLVTELESKIESSKIALNNFSTAGISVGGEHTNLTMSTLTNTVRQSTSHYVTSIAECERKLSILSLQYYDFALKKYIELGFGNVTTSAFLSYRERVDNYFSTLSSESILKLQAIEEKLDSDNPEMYSQAITTCRRLFTSISDELFKKYFPNYNGKSYKTLSGKELDISGDHYLNRLSAVIEKTQGKAAKNTLTGSHILYLIDWIENLSNLQCKGVHDEIGKADAQQCIIHTYTCLGDILSALNEN